MLTIPKPTDEMNKLFDEFKDSKDERLIISFSKRDGSRYKETIDVPMKYIKQHRWDVFARACEVLQARLEMDERIEPVVDFGIVLEDSEEGIEIFTKNTSVERWTK